MAASMNKVILIGRLGQDPKLSYTPDGAAVCNMRMATDESYKDRQTNQWVDRAEWHSVVAWRQSAEYCGNYLSKGDLVMVEGKLQTRKWQDRDGNDRYTTEIQAQRVQNLSPRQQQAGGYQQQQQGGYQRQPQQQGGYQQQQGGYQQQPPQQPQQQQPANQQSQEEDLGPAFPSEASGMDDVPF